MCNFPEGVSHLSSQPERVKAGPARMILLALRRAREEGKPDPCIVPIGHIIPILTDSENGPW